MCHKHRLRIKESRSDIFTCGPYKVKYCKGCGWEKTISPKDTIIVDYPITGQEGCQGVQGTAEMDLSPVGAPEAVVEPITGEEPVKKGFMSKIMGVFIR
jgi:hypothetical protein